MDDPAPPLPLMLEIGTLPPLEKRRSGCNCARGEHALMNVCGLCFICVAYTCIKVCLHTNDTDPALVSYVSFI